MLFSVINDMWQQRFKNMKCLLSSSPVQCKNYNMEAVQKIQFEVDD